LLTQDKEDEKGGYSDKEESERSVNRIREDELV